MYYLVCSDFRGNFFGTFWISINRSKEIKIFQKQIKSFQKKQDQPDREHYGEDMAEK